MSKETPSSRSVIVAVGEFTQSQTLRALVRLYRPYKDAFRGKMGHVAQDAEDVHVHRCSALITGGRAPFAQDLSDRGGATSTRRFRN